MRNDRTFTKDEVNALMEIASRLEDHERSSPIIEKFTKQELKNILLASGIAGNKIEQALAYLKSATAVSSLFDKPAYELEKITGSDISPEILDRLRVMDDFNEMDIRYKVVGAIIGFGVNKDLPD